MIHPAAGRQLLGRRVGAPKWLDRRIASPGPYLTLCLSEAEYKAAMKHCRVAPGAWINPGADATSHHLVSENKRVCVVCLGNMGGRSAIEVAGLLVHEAVHVWQEYADSIGESTPGREQEAYAIQAIAQELMAEYARRLPPC